MSSETQTPAPTRRLLSYQEAAAVYGVKHGFLRRVPRNELPRIVLGHKLVMLDVDDLDRYFNSKKVA